MNMLELIGLYDFRRPTQCTLTQACREKDRQTIAQDTAAFLAAGKKIKVVANTLGGIEPGKTSSANSIAHYPALSRRSKNKAI